MSKLKIVKIKCGQKLKNRKNKIGHKNRKN